MVDHYKHKNIINYSHSGDARRTELLLRNDGAKRSSTSVRQRDFLGGSVNRLPFIAAKLRLSYRYKGRIIDVETAIIKRSNGVQIHRFMSII
jgi:hypothetical protein